MQVDTDNMQGLPLKAFEEIPEAKNSAKEIVALVKDHGKVTGYQLSDGQVVDKEQGVTMAKQGDIANVGIAVNQGNEYLKSIPDGTEDNNLGSLPSISDKYF